MLPLRGSVVLVVGLGDSGQAAARLLRQRGAARVVAVDGADHADLRITAARLIEEGIEVRLGIREAPGEDFHYAVISPGVPVAGELAQSILRRRIPLVAELELGWQACPNCPTIAITGTNGKTTTTELVERMLLQSGRRTRAAGNIGLPLCALAESNPPLDFLTLEVSSFQLETIDQFHPAIAVLLNLTPDHFDRYSGMEDYLQAKARLFQNQTPGDWAVIQWEAWDALRRRGVWLRATPITFSSREPRADVFEQGGVLYHRRGPQALPLCDRRSIPLAGPHNTENLMAVLAVGQILNLPSGPVQAALASYVPAAHRCEVVTQAQGITFVNDSKATNVDAVAQALQTVPAGRQGEANIWLIAGGKDKGFSYDELGPLLTRRVKGAFLLGEAREKIRDAWSRFTPCSTVDTLPQAVCEAADRAVSGDVVLLSPACSSFDMFQNYQQRGEVFCRAVEQWTRLRARRDPEPAEVGAARAPRGQACAADFKNQVPGGTSDSGPPLLNPTTNSSA
jgi:UDP-N-acetylmuramoylalanine--D-glutamate ligase